jgi:hypothetical protein
MENLDQILNGRREVPVESREIVVAPLGKTHGVTRVIADQIKQNGDLFVARLPGDSLNIRTHHIPRNHLQGPLSGPQLQFC